MTDNRTTELLPCPFCGGEAECEMHFTHKIFRVTCAGSQCHIMPRTVWHTTEAEAIAAWNTRAPVEYDGWFYLPKPKESIVQYGAPRIEKTETGYMTEQPVEVIEGAIRSWGDKLGEHIMKRICEVWYTRATHGTLTAEQVRSVLLTHLPHREYYSVEQTDAWQAIADELNATLGDEECKITGSSTNNLMYPDYMTKWYELSCGHSVTLKGSEPPRFCPKCGMAVKR